MIKLCVGSRSRLKLKWGRDSRNRKIKVVTRVKWDKTVEVKGSLNHLKIITNSSANLNTIPH
jgi:hypothetical protein